MAVTAEGPGTPPLPDPVRARVLGWAADCLGALPGEQVPTALRPFARFAPARRVRHAATPLAVALERDAVFRQRVADTARGALPDLAAAVESGTVPAAAPAVEVAALAFLLRPPGWEDHVAAAAAGLSAADEQVAARRDTEALRRLQAELAEARGRARELARQHRGELATERAEIARLRSALREAEERARRAGAAGQAAAEAARATEVELARQLADATTENRRLARRVAELTAAAEAGRRAAREGRSGDEVRLAVLVKALGDLAAGLRQELALPTVVERPADALAGAGTGPDPVVGGLGPEDPAVLDALLRTAGSHLVVDGYNVTKSGYGELPLRTQRERLATGLGALAAQTRAEVTVVFDGAESTATAAPAPRGVRVLFSPGGVTADEWIRRICAAEPPGRQVVVVSSDREVVDGVRRPGVWAVPSATLLRRLDRS